MHVNHILLLQLTSRLEFIKQIIYDDTIRGRELSEPWIKKLDDIRRAGDAVTDEELSAARQSVQPGDTLRLFSTSVSTAAISVTFDVLGMDTLDKLM